jgi:hypothetical protein
MRRQLQCTSESPFGGLLPFSFFFFLHYTCACVYTHVIFRSIRESPCPHSTARNFHEILCGFSETVRWVAFCCCCCFDTRLHTLTSLPSNTYHMCFL